MCSQNRIYIRCIFRVGQIRMSAFQISYIRIFKYRIYVCPLHPRSVACSFADLEGFTITSSFPQAPPPFMHMHTSPSTPSVTSLTITGFLRLSDLWLRIAQKNTARIRRIYGITPYIAIYTPYKYVYTEFGYGGGRLENTTYIPYRIIHIIIRKRFWPTLCISSDFPAKNNACTPYVYMVLANPSYMYSVSCCLSFLQEVFLTAAEYFGTLVFSYPFSSKKGRNIGKTISRLFTKLYFWILMFAGWLL